MEPRMPWLRILFLITAYVATSAWSVSDLVGGKYRFRCYFACVDQTSTQNDYVEMRDHCRELAQLKSEMAMKEAGISGDENSRKATLVSVFSKCMGANGWSVPDGKDPNKAVVAGAGGGGPQVISQTAATAVTAPTAAVASSTKREAHARLTRSAECSYARNSASVSSIAATRAKACDLECAKALELAPDAPRPASCPPEEISKYAHGNVE